MFPPKGYPYSAVRVSGILFKTMQRKGIVFDKRNSLIKHDDVSNQHLLSITL